MAAKLDIVGCGRLGRTLARLWHQSGTFEIGRILNRSRASAAEAAGFIGAGQPVNAAGELMASDLLLIATSDDAIEDCCRALAESEAMCRGAIVFHCSGALSSEVLASARARGASLASVHPVKSFAAPGTACQSFAGTYCGIEGDDDAVIRLREAFEAIGARLFTIDARFKTLYHAGAVIACSYLVSLVELGLRCYEKAGIPRATAEQILAPLVSGTVENTFGRGTVNALTGPIARAEASVVAKQIEALAEWDPRLAALYRDIGSVALELSRAQGSASPEALAELQRVLEACRR